MYEVESTNGYVLNYYNAGEADRRYRILTPQNGVIQLSATSVRKETSKMRFWLQRFNLVSVDYIHGRVGYKSVGGELVQKCDLSGVSLSVVARVGELIERLTTDQDDETNLFVIFDDLMQSLRADGSKWEEKDLQVVELWAKARVLHEFGYFDYEGIAGVDPAVFQKDTLTQIEIGSLSDKQRELERAIHDAVMQSML